MQSERTEYLKTETTIIVIYTQGKEFYIKFKKREKTFSDLM